jgi:hypothetical protein
MKNIPSGAVRPPKGNGSVEEDKREESRYDSTLVKLDKYILDPVLTVFSNPHKKPSRLPEIYSSFEIPFQRNPVRFRSRDVRLMCAAFVAS